MEEGPRDFFGKLRKPSTLRTPISSIDIVVYAAQLVSNPESIDDMLDSLRMITSHLEPGQQPTPQDNAELENIYSKVEQYLLEQEPIRKFTQETLRQEIQNKLHLLQQQTTTTFWPDLMPSTASQSSH